MSIELIDNPADTIDHCRCAVSFLREAMCCGPANGSWVLSQQALAGLAFVYEAIDEKLKEASDGSLLLYTLFRENSNREAKNVVKTQAAA